MEKEVGCFECSRVMRSMAGWLFADIIHKIVGETKIIILDGGGESKNISFGVTRKWLEANHGRNSGYGRETVLALREHAQFCESNECTEARDRILDMLYYKDIKKLTGSYGFLDDIVLSGIIDSCHVLDPQNGWEKIARELRPCISWFEEKNLWLWPE